LLLWFFLPAAYTYVRGGEGTERLSALLLSLLLSFVLPRAYAWVWVGEGTEPLCGPGDFKEDALTPRVVFAAAGLASLLCLVLRRCFAWVLVASATEPLPDLVAI